MNSRPETPTHTTGAHRAHRAGARRPVPRAVPQRPPTRYEPCLDGLFTYCLSVLCDHDEATAALGDALALAERRGSRAPDTEADHRAWLYALARWSCLRRLAEAKRRRQGAHTAEGVKQATEPAAPPGALLQEEQRRQLGLLAWPEAAGTTPEQREALELAVRHQLSAPEVAAVLGSDPGVTRELLASAACEVERTRAALAVVETGTCPGVNRLTGDNQLLLSAALRRELVRHVDDCPRCRRTAERATPGTWPGTSVTPAALPLVEAPRAALHQAMHASRPAARAPRFDRRGFPMDPKDRAARRDKLRARAVTTTVVATVVAAPVLALWAAYRGAPMTGEGTDGRSVSASEAGGSGELDGERTGDGYGYENAGNAQTTPDPRFTAGSRSPDVSVEVISPPTRASTGSGRLTVTARPSGAATLITLTASGSSAVHWSAHTGAHWLWLSQRSGTLRPGETATIRVYVDHDREPAGHWSARIGIAPSGAAISLSGYGRSGSGDGSGEPGPGPTPSDPSSPSDPDPTPTPSDPGTTEPDPTPTPSDPSTSPEPDPTPSGTASPGTGDPSSATGSP
ncbi:MULTISPECIES: sigma-70 family RNA polymerase sigma factor [unclassified Streptomyces]|uniref:sigma-70 family RNA polymerase sigma factor n=1 Tax=unclassified Streptomyces TaxID=2593676 RepID=UPI0019272FA3|nr:MULTISPECIES: sigma-70 family RNA polymerase sigma factor [unclassified Streptomyces]